jgi:hypothetical protein
MRLRGFSNVKRLFAWDATPLAPRVCEHREALGLVKWLCRELLTAEELDVRIRRDQTISENVRLCALAIAPSYRDCLVHHKADNLIADLKHAGSTPAQIVEQIRANPTISDEVRKQALIVARQSK